MPDVCVIHVHSMGQRERETEKTEKEGQRGMGSNEAHSSMETQSALQPFEHKHFTENTRTRAGIGIPERHQLTPHLQTGDALLRDVWEERESRKGREAERERSGTKRKRSE